MIILNMASRYGEESAHVSAVVGNALVAAATTGTECTQRGVPAKRALAEALKLHVKERLAPYKYPRWIEFASELPKTATGKIQRYKLRASNA